MSIVSFFKFDRIILTGLVSEVNLVIKRVIKKKRQDRRLGPRV